MPLIVVNGKNYANLDEMPPEIRQAYEQALGVLHDGNQNGVPDILEGLSGGKTSTIQTTQIQNNQMQFIADGKVYTSAAELPPEARQKYAQAMAKLGSMMVDADGNGIPDSFEKEMPAASGADEPDIEPTVMDLPAGITQNPPASVISEVTSNYGRIFVIVITALVVLSLIGFGLIMGMSLPK